MSDNNPNYKIPSVDLLKENNEKFKREETKFYTETVREIRTTLDEFGIKVKIENVSVGPVFTIYELKLENGSDIKKIKTLKEDLEFSLGVKKLNINVISGKKIVEISIENSKRNLVTIKEIFESENFKKSESKLTIVLGKDIYGTPQISTLEDLSHVLIAGSTCSGKSTFLNSLINSILYKATSDEVNFMMIDTKLVELSVYNNIPHLIIPTITDPKKALGGLAWIVKQIEDRYELFSQNGVKSLKEYNNLDDKNLPSIVVVADELSDLIVADKKKAEELICKISQKGAKVGVHLVLVVQRPVNNILTGNIKYSFPTKISFILPTLTDSKAIIDFSGAENLLAYGDMLVKKVGEEEPIRIHSAFISDEEIKNVVEFIIGRKDKTYDEITIRQIDKYVEHDYEEIYDEPDVLLDEVIDAVVSVGIASTSFIQRRFKIGYSRTCRIMDQLEIRGIISGYEGNKPRRVLMTEERLKELRNIKN